jgi:hypothetical protein
MQIDALFGCFRPASLLVFEQKSVWEAWHGSGWVSLVVQALSVKH